MSLTIKPITFKAASQYVNENHRHNKASVGCKFCLSVYDGQRLCGVAICGRPIARKLDDGQTMEINRVCTDGTYNACSILYGACCRVAKEMGYKKAVTYTLLSENGASLKASHFVDDGIAGGLHWTGERNKGQDYLPNEMKRRWYRIL